MTKKKFSLGNWILDNKFYLIAFFIPVICMVFVYYFKDIFPFGDQMYLRSDCYHQYTPYLEILRDKLTSGGSLLYTWELGAGMNFVAIAAYYLASPLNLLLLLWPGTTADAVSFFIILKMGLAGFGSCYYFTKHFGHKNIGTVAFSMAYALSAYFAAFSWNIMWLDCMFLLPFIMLGLEKLVKDKKCKMYCIALGLSIFSNYYIGIMLCIFSVIYFTYLIITIDFEENVNKLRARFIIIKDYVLYSLLAGTLAACAIIPAWLNLSVTKSATSEFPAAIEEYFSVLYMLFRSLIFIPVADLKYPHDPNIYCSVAVFLLVPLYFMCKKIKAKERIGKAVLLAVFLLSFSFNIPNYIWHGLHFPNSLPCRQSFIYILLILTMAYEAFLHIKEFSVKQIVGTLGVVAGLLFIFEEIFKGVEFFTNYDALPSMTKIIYVSLLFLVIYAALMCWYKYKPKAKFFLAYLMIIICFFELTLNMAQTGLGSTSSRDAYYESNDAYDELNDKAKAQADSEGVNFYRTEEVSHRTRNDGALFGYNSISTFSSVSSANMQTYYNLLGMQTSYNAYSYYGHTPLTSALFSIKYEYTTSAPSLPNQSSLLATANYNNTANAQTPLYLYQNNYCLPLGFMINSSTMSNWDTSSGNPFEVQNNFVQNAVAGTSPIFHNLQSSTVGTFTAAYAQDGTSSNVANNKPGNFDIYFYTTTSSESLTATITAPDGTTSTQTFSSTNQNYICHIGDVAANSTITVTTSDGSALSICYAYAFDAEAWAVDYELLNANPYNVDSYTDTKITGKINAKTDGLMYTSIPYDEGWSVYVDGKKAKTTAICSGALTGVYMSSGEHTVTFKYCPKGFIFGTIISILAIITLLCLIFKSNIIEFIDKKKTHPKSIGKK